MATSGMIPVAKRQKGPHKVDISKGSAWICRCGQSSKFPYCDGTHKAVNAKEGTNYSPIEVSMENQGGKTEVYICGCSWSNLRKTGQPFCDGTHRGIVDLEAGPAGAAAAADSKTEKKYPKLKLTYFAGRGRAELSRYILAQAGIPYEDVRVKSEDWPKLKPSTPYGQMPLLNVDGVDIAQSGAIARYLANLGGLNGDNAIQAAHIDGVYEAISDAIKDFVTARYIKDDAEKKAKFAAYFKDTLPVWAGKFEAQIKANGGTWIVGSKVSLADLALFNMITAVETANADAIKDFPLLTGLKKRVAELPRIAEWIKNRPASEF